MEQLERLAALRSQGVLSEEEFLLEKARLLESKDEAQGVTSYSQDEPMPDSGMIWAILSTLFCFFPFGVVAIVKASQVNPLWISDHCNEAREAAAGAKKWSIISAVAGAILGIIYIAVAAAAR